MPLLSLFSDLIVLTILAVSNPSIGGGGEKDILLRSLFGQVRSLISQFPTIFQVLYSQEKC